MQKTFLVTGSVLVAFSFVWGYLWLEVLRDPEQELRDFYLRYPSIRKVVAALSKAWLPVLLLGVSLVATSLLIPENL